ncbi:MAG TPA: hypothetical protein VEL31_23760 [Ktedonobacteraceae bacterium]|nr:hypothetical protein [Ktedonobacteraceae bacterium]
MRKHAIVSLKKPASKKGTNPSRKRTVVEDRAGPRVSNARFCHQ